MKIIKKIGKWIFRTILGIVFLLLAYLLMAGILMLIPSNSDFKETEDGIQIFLISNGVHTDLCLPVYTQELDWTQWIPTADFKPASYQYISFGWGDKGFYLETPQWEDLQLSVAFNAVFLPSPTAMHVTFYAFTPQKGDKVKSIVISPQQYQQLVLHIQESFQLDAHQKPILIDCCRYARLNDNFYEAQGNYHFIRTCNEWTNEGLKRAGIKTACWAPFETGILYHRN